jgi:hypothetical protein
MRLSGEDDLAKARSGLGEVTGTSQELSFAKTPRHFELGRAIRSQLVEPLTRVIEASARKGGLESGVDRHSAKRAGRRAFNRLSAEGGRFGRLTDFSQYARELYPQRNGLGAITRQGKRGRKSLPCGVRSIVAPPGLSSRLQCTSGHRGLVQR